MKKKYFLLIVIVFLSYGCSPPPISVLYLSGSKFNDYVVYIDESPYFIIDEYDLNTFSERLEDSLITYAEVTTIEDKEKTYKKINLSDSLLICIGENVSDSISINQIKYVYLFRASTSDEKSQGWLQVVGWPLIAFLIDVGYKKEDDKQSYNATLVGIGLGLGFGSLFFFDHNKPYEKIYFKHS